MERFDLEYGVDRLTKKYSEFIAFADYDDPDPFLNTSEMFEYIKNNHDVRHFLKSWSMFSELFPYATLNHYNAILAENENLTWELYPDNPLLFLRTIKKATALKILDNLKYLAIYKNGRYDIKVSDITTLHHGKISTLNDEINIEDAETLYDFIDIAVHFDPMLEIVDCYIEVTWDVSEGQHIDSKHVKDMLENTFHYLDFMVDGEWMRMEYNRNGVYMIDAHITKMRAAYIGYDDLPIMGG